MRILISPQVFKSGLRGMEAAQAITQGVRRVYLDADLVLLPVADGGDGTLEALVQVAPLPSEGRGAGG